MYLLYCVLYKGTSHSFKQLHSDSLISYTTPTIRSLLLFVHVIFLSSQQLPLSLLSVHVIFFPHSSCRSLILSVHVIFLALFFSLLTLSSSLTAAACRWRGRREVKPCRVHTLIMNIHL